jgi:hypothetical protein
MRALLLAGTLMVSACATPVATPSRCAAAEQAVDWAKIGLELACTSESKSCDTAGLVLRAANTAMKALCPKPE